MFLNLSRHCKICLRGTYLGTPYYPSHDRRVRISSARIRTLDGWLESENVPLCYGIPLLDPDVLIICCTMTNPGRRDARRIRQQPLDPVHPHRPRQPVRRDARLRSTGSVQLVPEIRHFYVVSKKHENSCNVKTSLLTLSGNLEEFLQLWQDGRIWL